MGCPANTLGVAIYMNYTGASVLKLLARTLKTILDKAAILGRRRVRLPRIEDNDLFRCLGHLLFPSLPPNEGPSLRHRPLQEPSRIIGDRKPQSLRRVAKPLLEAA